MMLLDDGILEHEKFVRAIRLAGGDAVHLWLGLRAYCAKKLTDGRIHEDMLSEVKGPAGRARVKALTALQASGLVHTAEQRAACPDCKSADAAADGIWMHDYLQWSESREEAQERRVSNRERQRRLRSRSRVSNSVTDIVTNASVTPSVTGPHTIPDPGHTKPDQTEERAGARDPVRSVDPLMNPEETVMPSGLRERALEPGNAVDHLTKVLKVPRAVIVAELEDFCRFREAGAGMGDKRSYWLKHFRQLILNRAKRNELKPIGRVEHEANAEARPPRRIKTIAELEQEALNARP